MAIYKEDIVDIELTTGNIHRSFLGRSIGEGDILANRFGVRVFRNGNEVSLNGVDCTGYFIRSTGDTVVIQGATGGNTAYVTIPESCYVYEGQFSLAIKLTGDGITGTMRIVDGTVVNTTTNIPVDPGTVIPSIEDLIEAINEAVASIPQDYSDFYDAFFDNYIVRTADFAIDGKYIYTDGTPTTNASWHTTGFKRIIGNSMNVQGNFSNLSGTGYNLALYASNGSFVRGYTFGNNTDQFFDMSGATFFRLCNDKSHGSAYYAFVQASEARTMSDTVRRWVTPTFSETGYLQTDGTVNSSSTDWSTTPFIKTNEAVMQLTGIFYLLTGVGYNVCLYDENRSFIKGFCPLQQQVDIYYDISEASYIRLSSHTPYLTFTIIFGLAIGGKKSVIVDKNGGGDYTSLLAAMKATPATTEIILMPGEYDLISEYQAYYGNDFFDNYQGYSGVSDPFYRGLWMGAGRKIHGVSGAVIKCEYTGDNTKVATLFSAIANGGDVLLENVTLKHGNLRYAIHDDYGANHNTITWKNIRFIGHSNGAVIGAGLGINSTVIIDGCVFESNTNRWDINYHGSNYAGANNVNKIYVKNCKGDKGFGIWPNGPSSALSTAFVSNCKFKEITLYRPDGQDQSQVMNVELIEWMNEVDS